MFNMMKPVYIILGLMFVGIGALGAVLPVLPTTPFLLVSFFFFTKGSKRWQQWFMHTRLYKQFLKDYFEKNGMTKKQKAGLLLFSDAMLAVPFFMSGHLYIKAALILLNLAKYLYFIFVIKTIKPHNAPD